MRFTTAVAAVLLALTPATLADAPTGGDWSETTTTTVTYTMSNTHTVTKYLKHANATTSSISSHPTGWNATAHTTTAATTFNKPTLTPASTITSASPSIASVAATGAASAQDINLAVAALAGAAAMVWGSL
ncbi:hypothetical protein H2202_007717 [Exophiala xenobiotica]|nr:hypothetical protein H2202_007717 [Exophiala xenobiotica]KAK5221709.1 hypothetical protein LTR47_010745 [Exophiala xenobiotica]KAK5247303.1 hypothetical protein LTS06_007483 [Exophiala xenobiotica]KAK5286647.1 hypothetical protein LTR14_009714 [Exophiala xenobiotica]KAK5346187.1 hypothetical protein LTR61_010053 [Exophiala xenobiotica]